MFLEVHAFFFRKDKSIKELIEPSLLSVQQIIQNSIRDCCGPFSIAKE